MPALSFQQQFARPLAAQAGARVMLTPNAEARALERGVPISRIAELMTDQRRRSSRSRQDPDSGSWVLAEGPIRVVWDQTDSGDIYISTVLHR